MNPHRSLQKTLFNKKRRLSNRFNPSRQQIVLFLLTGSTLLIGMTALITYRVVRGLILDNLKQQELLQVELCGSQIDRWLAARKAEVASLASSPTLNEMDWQSATSYLRAEANRIQDFHLFMLVTPNSMSYNTNVGQINLNTDFRDQLWFISGMQGQISVADPVMSRTTGTAEVYISAPVSPSSDMSAKAVLAGGIKLDRITEVVRGLQEERGSYAFAVNSQGMMIIHPDAPDVIGQDNLVPSLLQSSNPTLVAIGHRMVNRQQGIELVNIDGSWRYIAYAPLKEANWSIALVIPRRHLESQLGSLNFLTSVLAGLLVIAIITVWRHVQAGERTRTRAAQAALLNSLTTRIRQSLELQTIIQTTVRELVALTQLNHVIFGWYNPQLQALEVVSEFPRGQSQQGRWFQPPDTDLQACLRQGETVQLRSIPADPTGANGAKTNAYVALAMPTEDGRLGYLIGLHAGPLSTAERELLRAVADQLAIAITQSHLYTQTQEQVKLLNKTLIKLQQTQTQLIQSEKMSSLGQLIAGIAHEINNPVNFIYGNLNHAKQYTQSLLELLDLYQQEHSQSSQAIKEKTDEIDLGFLREDLPKLLGSIQVGAHRIREIVQSLRLFSRLDEAEVKDVNIHEGIDSTLMILQNRLKAKPDHPGIEVVKKYGELPLVECYAGQLNQVFMNVLSNAIDALEERDLKRTEQDLEANPSIITIRTDIVRPNYVAIRIADNGPGMNEEVQHRLFDPFFTTKPVGKGTGMGLAISYQIVTERHGGRLHFTTALGRGSEFIIEIPIQQRKPSPKV